MRQTLTFAIVMFVCASQGCELYLRKDFVGHVVDRQSQRPVAGVAVEASYAGMNVFRPSRVRATTDRNGRFEIRIPNSDSMKLVVGGEIHKTGGTTQIEGGDYFDLKSWYREHGGWLEGSGGYRYAVWFTPASKDIPPDLGDMNDPVPPYRRGHAATR
jgi:hypothetical protein